jgi:capsule assembly protein Wzi
MSWSPLTGQSVRPAARTEVYAGSELETYLRTLQVAGIVRPYPWSARRFTEAEVDRLLPGDSAHPWAVRYDWRPAPPQRLSVALARPEVSSRLNSGFPYGYNDGAVWAGRGVTFSAQGGVVMRYGSVAASLRPLVSWASNSPFRLEPNGQTGRLKYADSRYPGSIDRPQRFGEGPYALADAGQSTLELAKWGVAVGVSTANDYWGPAADFPVILGNNAAGFPRVFAGTAAPIDLWVVRVQIRALLGRLTQSAYSPQTGGSQVRAASGAVLVLSPRRPQGLELGATRFTHRTWAGWSRVLAELTSPFHFSSRNDSLENGLASVFFRWLVPRAAVEVYGEYGTDDIRYNLREAFVEPDHIAGYTIGLRRVSRRAQGGLRVIRTEIQNLQRGTLVQSRSQGPFYIHGRLSQGHTYRGQILGSEWGVGGAATKVAVDWYSPRGRLTVAWSRLMRGDPNDSVATMPQNPRGLDVMHTLGVERLLFRGRYDFLTGVTAVYEFNRDFRRDAFNLNVVFGMRAALR